VEVHQSARPHAAENARYRQRIFRGVTPTGRGPLVA
jgi:hypothetical protein